MNTKYIVTFLYAPAATDSLKNNVNNMIGQLVGVKNVASNRYVKSIVDIEYDPLSVTSSDIVRQIKQKGIQIALIAM